MEGHSVILLLTASLILQFTAAFLALRLVRQAEQALAWLLIGAAVFMMAVRRLITLFRTWQDNTLYLADPMAEWVALGISLLMVAGIARMAPLLTSSRRSMEALRESEERFYALAKVSPVGIFQTDAKGRFFYANERYCEIAGLAPRAISGDGWMQALHPDDRARVLAAWERAVGEKAAFKAEYRFLSSSGVTTWVFGQTAPERNNQGEIAGHVGTVTDITELKRVESALHAHVNQQKVVGEIGRLCLKTGEMQSVLDRSVQSIADTLKVDLCGILLLSEGGDSLQLASGWGWGEGVVGQYAVSADSESLPWHTLEINGPVISEDLRTETRFKVFLPIEENQVTSVLSVPMVSRGNRIGVLSVCSKDLRRFEADDVEFLQSVSSLLAVAIERRRAEASLEESADRDTLTGLNNRRNFNLRISQEMVIAEKNKHNMAILLCDLDGFKKVNDTWGHLAGDNVLKVVAQSIQESTRGSDLFFRWGGDEMVVVLPKVTREGVLVAAQRIREGVRKVAAKLYPGLDLSIGISLFPEHGTHVDDLVRIADRSMYIAKKGGDKIHIGEEEYELDEKSIKVVFQPVVDVRTHQINGYEALSRDAYGKLNVGALFSKYQAVGQLNEFKALCFRSQLKVAREIGLGKVFLNIDFAVLSGLQPDFTPPGMDIVLEISESEALHDVENHLEITKKWREYGYKFAIDDFGAGFISLPFIARLVPDHIKLDRSTILQAVDSPDFKEVLKDLLLGLRNCSREGIIAEGVENTHELEVVQELGIYLVQGFLLGKPEELKRT